VSNWANLVDYLRRKASVHQTLLMTAHHELSVMLNDSGVGFDDATLAERDSAFRELDTASREEYRDRNAREIAASDSARVLIVAGPGTGKSYLFLERIRDWLNRFPGERIYVSSFVRKLVRDLKTDILTSDLSRAEKSLVLVTTLHGLARSLLERNGGTREFPLRPYIRIIGQAWKDMVWGDVLSLHPELPTEGFNELEHQFHDRIVMSDDPWPPLRDAYFQLCQFYNAVGFADLILHATEALRENPDLNEHRLWIVDEYQDFNAAEAELLRLCTETADGVLLAGDDDQALYQSLKASHPEIIRASYRDDHSFAKAMLPFCGRCSFHICMAATGFLERQREADSIRKVFLPVKADPTAELVHLVACSTPGVAVNYVVNFIEGHRGALADRKDAISAGEAKDPFLLVLSHQKEVAAFFGAEADRLMDALEEWRLETADPGDDYFRVLTYLGHARAPTVNFTLRKVLVYEGTADTTAHEILAQALREDSALSEVPHDAVKDAFAKAKRIQEIIEGEALSAKEKAGAIASIVPIEDQDRLAADLDAFPSSGETFGTEEEEEIETAGAISAAAHMTMVGAKGLSADHVILLGFDDVNMSAVSPQQFFVAMTRARESLHLLTAFRARGSSLPHAFLADVPPEHCYHVRRTSTEETTFASRGEFLDYFERVRTARSMARRARRPHT
jgi:superfamily I DNA/RNA helicase